MKKEPEKTIGQMAVESPELIPIFEKLSLDYYQKGNQTLEEACQGAGVEAAKVRQELETQKSSVKNERVDESSSLSEIVHYIVQHHHRYVRGQLERMEGLLMTMGDDPGSSSHAGILKKLFFSLDEALRHHLLEEEIEVFPRLLWFERNGKKPGPVEEGADFLGSVYHILLDHRMMDKEFREMKKLVFHFKSLNPTDEKMEDFSKILEDLDLDNHQHIHLENNVLLRKASALGIIERP